MLAVEKKDTPSIVKQIVAEQLAHDPKMIDVRQHIKGELGADSMDSIELMMACEDEFGIEIADEEAEKVVTVGDLIHLILTKTEEVEEVTPAADSDPLEMPDQDQSHRPVVQMLVERGDYLVLDEPHFDLAIVGIAERPGLSAVVYDSEQVIRALMEHELMDRDEATEWFDHNIAGSHLGENSPLFLERLGEPQGDVIDRLCDILRVPADKLVGEVERMTAALSASVSTLRSDLPHYYPQWMDGITGLLDRVAEVEPINKSPTDVAIDRMSTDVAAWLDDLLKTGINLVLGRSDWSIKELAGRLKCVEFRDSGVKRYALDDVEFLEVHDVDVRPEDLGGADGHTLRYSMRHRFLIGGAVDYQPKRDEPGLYLDSGEFVPASELKGWHGGSL